MTSCYLISVMHTGTTFLEQLIRPSLGFQHLHVHEEDLRVKMGCADVVVAPLRDPRSVWRSFCLRGTPRAYFWAGWETLARACAARSSSNSRRLR